jgi:hypothetical protein
MEIFSAATEISVTKIIVTASLMKSLNLNELLWVMRITVAVINRVSVVSLS